LSNNKPFLNEDFLLESDIAQYLYHEHAAGLPIIDYHCHLPPEDIAADRKFSNLAEIWLHGDHYKWRAMRANGIDEAYCTGDADDYEKFFKWAETVPYTMRNPLYQWTHLELRRYFGIDKILNKETAKDVYEECTRMLQTDAYSVRNLLRKMNVEVVCTTDDPADSLEYHQQIAADGFEVKILPAFRADNALKINDSSFPSYIRRLEEVAGLTIQSWTDLKDALIKRHDYFHEMGCRLSDHGLEWTYAQDYIDSEVAQVFQDGLEGKNLDGDEVLKYKSALLHFLGELDHSRNWIQQYHIGALRNNNLRQYRRLGPDTGFDSIGDFSIAQPLSRLLSRLDMDDKLAKTIIYNLNPSDNEVVAAMAGNFNDGSVPGKIQFGAAWWFLDQKDGIEKQLNTLSNLGLISRFVGMLTDSRSFLSYPRHEYFRRILCNVFASDIKNGELPASELPWIGQLVENSCYYNAREYFNFPGYK